MDKVLVIGIVGESVFMKCDHFHKPGETIKVDNIYSEIGGKGFNQALTIKKLGGNVKFICSLGNDSIKEKCINEINKLNVDFEYFIDNKKMTAYATILTNKLGDNQVSVYQGSSLNISNLNEIFNEIDQAEYILLQLEIPYDINLAIVKYAKSKGKKVILNPAPVADISELLKYVDIITPNEIEIITLFGSNYQEELIDKPFKTIVTRGDKSTLLFDKSMKEFDTHKVQVKDTTGAGDAFNGALVYQLANQKSIEEAIIFANKVASHTVQYDYVLPGILSLEQSEK